MNTGGQTRTWAAMTATGFTGEARSLMEIIVIRAAMRHTRSTSSAGAKASVCIRMKVGFGNTVIATPATDAIRRRSEWLRQ